MLWTYRTGRTSAFGNLPRDHTGLVMLQLRLAGNSELEREVERKLQDMPSRRAVLSSCLANPGDSGGPLVDDTGQVIGVTYAIPREPGHRSFTYHVDLSELKGFLQGATTIQSSNSRMPGISILASA